MQIDYKRGLYVATNVADRDLDGMLARGWKPKDGALVTSHIKNVTTYAEHAVGEAKKKVEPYVQKKLETLQPSFALDCDGTFPAPDGLAYRPYQRAGIAYGLQREHVLIGDAMRLGKTIQGIGIANATTSCRRVLTVSPATAKINWLREWTKWNNKDSQVHLVDAKNGWNDDAENVVINYDILGKWKDKIFERKWDQVIFDESHYLKGPDSQRTKLSFEIKADRHVLLSGTPLYTRPRDLWTTVRRCDRWSLGANEFAFLQRYCGAVQDPFTKQWSFDGGSNLEELQALMRERFMIRREKGDVVNELPTNRQTVVVPADKFATLLRQERGALNTVAGRAMALAASDGSLADWLAERPDLDGIERDDATPADETQLSSVRKELAIAKIPFVVEHIEALLQTEKKVVVFAHHREVVEALTNAFALYGSVKLYGGMAGSARQASIDRFCTDDNCRVFVGNIIAAGQAIDLSVADVAVFAELSWVPSEMDQAEERVWSVMKEWPVTLYRIVVEGSLDEVMSIVLDRRQKDITKTMRIKALL